MTKGEDGKRKTILWAVMGVIVIVFAFSLFINL
ncbi:MAG: hypothetical protein JWO25_1661 [Alphaproteobacteria bacterium]|nr:hypothetical protein [Alphaproteobacteria bacterium]MDB5721705.1 hypothetical protein [Alphaproteobacteria bacterium]